MGAQMKAMAALRASGLANILPQSFGGGGGDDLATIMEPEGSDSGSKHPSVRSYPSSKFAPLEEQHTLLFLNPCHVSKKYKIFVC